MIYADDWKAISIRIQGMMKAAELHARFLANKSDHNNDIVDMFELQCNEILASLESYLDEHNDTLPSAFSTVSDLIDTSKSKLNGAKSMHSSKPMIIQNTLVSIAAFESQISFLLSDTQSVIRTKSERAFAHLQRSIVADTDFRSKWTNAFKDGEVACEKLGAIHLLLHGIYAFKIHATGERTDLVFQDIRTSLTDEQRYADGLVLTEWKKASDDSEASRQFKAAKEQAARYARGSLGGSELAGYRYLVVVTREHVNVPADIVEGTVTYRHLNIAVEPSTPSGKKTSS